MTYDPYSIATYCHGCRSTLLHYLKPSLTTDAAKCYECPECGYLVWSKREERVQ